VQRPQGRNSKAKEKRSGEALVASLPCSRLEVIEKEVNEDPSPAHSNLIKDLSKVQRSENRLTHASRPIQFRYGRALLGMAAEGVVSPRREELFRLRELFTERTPTCSSSSRTRTASTRANARRSPISSRPCPSARARYPITLATRTARACVQIHRGIRRQRR